MSRTRTYFRPFQPILRKLDPILKFTIYFVIISSAILLNKVNMRIKIHKHEEKLWYFMKRVPETYPAAWPPWAIRFFMLVMLLRINASWPQRRRMSQYSKSFNININSISSLHNHLLGKSLWVWYVVTRSVIAKH